MQSFTVEFVLGIEAMNEESAENKLDTFLSALDLKKNDKLELIEMGELVSSDGTKSKKKAVKEDIDFDEDDEDWDDEWANEDWDSIDEDEEEP